MLSDIEPIFVKFYFISMLLCVLYTNFPHKITN